ncbi:MAG: SWIM zinc finger family protein [Chloroflexi bacterium]|nr:SWIM zinc finger family protein [Chloroflexota bacterium]
MSRYDWGWGKSRPRRPADGIKAQTQSGRFGKTWWAGLWIAALERLVDSARLSRGRSYARSGQVVKLEVGRGGVSAKVQGSRPSPYKVSIQFKALSDAEWERVADAIAAQAIYAAKLLSGEMPETIEDAFKAAGASLFPTARLDLETTCSCPDWANPCKHVAAVHYLLGERFDADPFLIFEMRGKSKEEIIAALRTRRAGGLPATDEATHDERADEVEITEPLCASPETFWTLPAEVKEMRMNFVAPPMDALLVKRLGKPPFWRGQRDFGELMERAYKIIGRHARRTAIGDR